MDFSLPFNWLGLRNSKLKFGIANNYKWRDFLTLQYLLRQRKVDQISGDPNEFMADENIWTVDTDRGFYMIGQKEPANTYTAARNVAAGYVMNECRIFEKVRMVYGLRVEKSINWYTGQNNTGSVVYDNAQVLDELDFLPAINFVFSLKEKSNIRASYGKTLARPSFKEKSIAQIYDPIPDRWFIGNIDLVQTDIHNGDLRYEHYFGSNQIFAVSGFYKHFLNPIEMISYQTAADQITARNAKDARVFGVELEYTKNLDFVSEKLKPLTVGLNATWVESRVDMTEIEVATDGTTEYELRTQNARTGEDVKKYRPMYGQSPYMLNSFIDYAGTDGKVFARLSYNVQGPKLSVIGIGMVPDVYERSFHNLDFNAKYHLGQSKKWYVGAGVSNILGQRKTKEYQSYEAESRIFEQMYGGRTFSLSVGVDFTKS